MGAPVSYAEAIARSFHAAYEELAPSVGYQTRPESAVPWDDVPEPNRRLMVAVVDRLLEGLVIEPGIAASYLVVASEERPG